MLSLVESGPTGTLGAQVTYTVTVVPSMLVAGNLAACRAGHAATRAAPSPAISTANASARSTAATRPMKSFVFVRLWRSTMKNG